MSREKLYWICQLLGWGFYGVLGFAIFYTFQSSGLKMALLQVTIVVVMIAFTHALRILLKKYNWLALPLPHLLLRLLATLLAIAVVAQVILTFVCIYLIELFTVAQFSFAAFWVYVFNSFVMLLLWSAIYVTVAMFRKQKQQEIDRWKLEASLKETELQALKTQLNPHFMFNSLNNIRSLVSEDPEKARQMITNLSELLRYGLQYTQHERVPLARELEVVESYLLLESVQLEERLKYTLEIDEQALPIEVPPMSVQLLVENAIKHGISRLPLGGTIQIKAQVTKGQLQVEVLNTGQVPEVQKSETGIGLRNASERLRLLFGSSTLQLLNKTTDTVSASFAIPLAQQV